MSTVGGGENPHAGQGPVVVDIGGDVGALVVVMPDDTIDLEVEIVPTGTAHQHDHGHDHDHHESGHHHDHAGVHPPHVAVVPRPVPSGGTVASLVFGALTAGTYDLYLRPSGPVQLTAEVVGGTVTEARWPGA